jgi:predicted transcriptional regulator
MLQTITTNLSPDAYKFLNEISSSTKKTKRQILEEALSLYKKYYLEQQIKKGFESRYEEYKSNINDFEDLQFQSLK